MTLYFTDEWTSRKAKILYRGATAPNPSKFFLCLSASTSLTRTSPIASFVAAELKAEYGYQRQQVLWPADGAFSTGNKRHEMPQVTPTWTPSGGSQQYQTVFLLADAHSKASEAWSPSSISGSTVTIASNLLSNGDSIIPVPNSGSTLPAPLVSGTAYKAINVGSGGAGTFQFSSDGSTPITLTNSGSGTFQLRYASGTSVLFQIEDAAVLVQDGKPLQYPFDMVELAAAYGVGV